MIRRTYHKPDVLCCAEGCTVPIGRGKLFCKGHYFSLPKPLRDALWDAWRAAMAARKAMQPRVAQAALNADYQAAYQACRDHLRAVPVTSAEAMTTIAADRVGRVVAYADGRML